MPARARPTPPLDVAWGALRDAKALLARLFPNALGFLSQGDHAVWVESDELLRAVREEGLAEAIGALVPADVLGEVERAHKAFGDVIGMSADVAPAAPKVDRAAARDAVYAAVTAYAVQVVAAADDADAATVEALRHALEPIVEQRVRTRKRAEEAVEEDDDTDGADTDGADPNGAPANDDDAAPAEGVSRVA